MKTGPEVVSQSRLALISATVIVALFLYGSAVTATPPDPAVMKDKSCSDMSCHGGLAKHKVLHAPLADDACDTCHDQEDESVHAFTYPEEGNALCTGCHGEFEGKHVHEAVANGECITCHNPHSTDTPSLLAADSVGELCNQCHEEVTEDLPFLHGPAAAGECTACHQPHASDNTSLLNAQGNGVCFQCHDDVEDELDEAQSKHQPVVDSCITCHSPHGSDHKLMLSDVPPALCLDCHEDISDTIDDATFKHSATTTGDTCLNCHLPHASTHATLMRDTSKKLCLSCHNKPIKSGERELINIADRIAKNSHQHGPIQSGECTPCHTPHGGERLHLLSEDFPTKFYSPFDEDRYALCFSCHDVEAFEEPQVEDETAFRNTTQNLHYLHVNKPQKGRTCLICHEVHASSVRGHIAESARFGKWRLPIGFTPTETGGSCQPGCHRPYAYDRDTHVNNLPAPVDAPPAQN